MRLVWQLLSFLLVKTLRCVLLSFHCCVTTLYVLKIYLESLGVSFDVALSNLLQDDVHIFRLWVAAIPDCFCPYTSLLYRTVAYSCTSTL